MSITSKKMPSQVSMSQDYKRKFTALWSMLSCATLSGIDYLCYLFHFHDYGRENKLDNFPPPHLIMSSVLVHFGCFYKIPKAGGNYKQCYLSQFWRLEVQDQGASMVK